MKDVQQASLLMFFSLMTADALNLTVELHICSILILRAIGYLSFNTVVLQVASRSLPRWAGSTFESRYTSFVKKALKSAPILYLSTILATYLAGCSGLYSEIGRLDLLLTSIKIQFSQMVLVSQSFFYIFVRLLILLRCVQLYFTDFFSIVEFLLSSVFYGLPFFLCMTLIELLGDAYALIFPQRGKS